MPAEQEAVQSANSQSSKSTGKKSISDVVIYQPSPVTKTKNSERTTEHDLETARERTRQSVEHTKRSVEHTKRTLARWRHGTLAVLGLTFSLEYWHYWHTTRRDERDRRVGE